MSYLLSLSRMPGDSVRPDPARTREILRPTPPTPLSGLIAEVFSEAEGPARQTILFTSIDQGAGVSWTASAVAGELAARGRKVLLIEASGLALLSRHEDVCVLCDRVGTDQAWVLGPEQVSRAEFPLSAARGRPAATLAALQREFPFIVLDAPSLSRSDVALRLAPLTEGAVLVLRQGRTKTRAVVQACDRFTTLGSQVLGCVYNAYSMTERKGIV